MPVSRVFDRIVMAVPELRTAIAEYQLLFGVTPSVGASGRGEPTARWGLPNTVVELVQAVVDRPGLQGIVFNVPGAGPEEKPVANALGIDLWIGDGRATADFRRHCPGAQCSAFPVDHVVLRTDNAQACIELFSAELGLRLALDKTVPEWGGRMLFFRAGKLTLEVIDSSADSPGGNYFWGLAYQCPDLAAQIKVLKQVGVAVSDLREGRKPGTRVATLKSHNLGIPTLLIQPAK